MMDDPRHELMRDLFGPRLRGHAADRLAGELAGRARALVTGALERGGGDFVTGVAQPFAVQSIALLMGVPEQDWDRLTAWVHEVLGFTNRRTGQPDEHSRKTFQAMHDYFRSFVAGKRDNPADDLGSLLACGEIAADRGEPPLRDHEREMNATVLVVSGVEQPRNTIAAGVLALAEHPEQWRALRADRSLLPSAIEEILRWTPANPYNRRTATRDVDLHGVRIRAGDKVTLWWPSANRDETVFDAPDRFDIRRNPNPHLSFGAGLHACVGDQVGRVEIRQILTELLDRVAHLRLTGPPRWAPNNKHTVLLDLPIELVPA